MALEFHELKKCFANLKFAKKKYVTILVYNKYLNEISEDEVKQQEEINKFRTFLLKNPEIQENKLTDTNFETGNNSLVLLMDKFLTVSEADTTFFWTTLKNVYTQFFPQGKPSIEETEQYLQDIAKKTIETKLLKNPILSGIFNKIDMSSFDMSTLDINSLADNEDIKSAALEILSGFQTNKYDMETLLETATQGLSLIENAKLCKNKEEENQIAVLKEMIQKIQQNELDINSFLGSFLPKLNLSFFSK